MIKDTELRLGNLVYYGQSIGSITMLQDHPLRKAVGVDNMITMLESINPIPLTSELLEKAGFEPYFEESCLGRTVEETRIMEEIGSTRMYRNGWKNSFNKSMHITDSFTCKGVKLKSLHQLQNLYFALTGEELEIQLTNP